ncbi:cupin domain-containing protein [bacterium]|nr:cupin domain-containing protein [bacterium]
MMSLSVLPWIARLLLSIALFAGGAVAALADGHGAASKPKMETLLSTELEGAPGTEVIVSRVALPANTSLPKHWHPGEEFAYVLEGSITLWQEGKEDTVIAAGQVGKVPLEQIHTVVTGDEGVTLLVFRVHEKGKPERMPAE